MKKTILSILLISLCSCSSFKDVQRSMYIDRWTESEKIKQEERFGYEDKLIKERQKYKGVIGYTRTIKWGCHESKRTFILKDMPNYRYKSTYKPKFFN